jgi:hypothetical protein
MSKKLAFASYDMQVNASRLRILAMSKLIYTDYLMGNSSPVIITACEWQEFFIESENPYRDLKRASNSLLRAKVLFEGKKEPINFLERVVYEPGRGEVELYFNPEFLKACV